MYHFNSNDEIIIQASREMMQREEKIYSVWFSDKRCDAISEKGRKFTFIPPDNDKIKESE